MDDRRLDNQMEENSHEVRLRKAIHDIQNDPSIDPSTKARRMQDLLTASWKQSRPDSRSSMYSSSNPSSSSLNGDNVMDVEVEEGVSYHATQPEPILGCKHYMRNCQKFAKCCNKWINCRLCHDEIEDHPYDRFSTELMRCMICKTEQKAAQSCEHCGTEMALYYCDVCKFWDNNPTKSIFHCDKCGICRVGHKGDFRHCLKCNACITLEYYPQHKCIERSLECDCSICGEYLFTSTAPVMFMPCGHSIHFSCHREHMKNSFQCPVCLKSLGDMRDYFTRLDSLMEIQKMPPEYAKVRSQILCNDCEAKTVTKFHFVYHKCTKCNSYNTKFIKSFTVASEDDTGEDQVPADHDNGAEQQPTSN